MKINMLPVALGVTDTARSLLYHKLLEHAVRRGGPLEIDPLDPYQPIRLTGQEHHEAQRPPNASVRQAAREVAVDAGARLIVMGAKAEDSELRLVVVFECDPSSRFRRCWKRLKELCVQDRILRRCCIQLRRPGWVRPMALPDELGIASLSRSVSAALRQQVTAHDMVTIDHRLAVEQPLYCGLVPSHAYRGGLCQEWEPCLTVLVRVKGFLPLMGDGSLAPALPRTVTTQGGAHVRLDVVETSVAACGVDPIIAAVHEDVGTLGVGAFIESAANKDARGKPGAGSLGTVLFDHKAGKTYALTSRHVVLHDADSLDNYPDGVNVLYPGKVIGSRVVPREPRCAVGTVVAAIRDNVDNHGLDAALIEVGDEIKVCGEFVAAEGLCQGHPLSEQELNNMDASTTVFVAGAIVNSTQWDGTLVTRPWPGDLDAFFRESKWPEIVSSSGDKAAAPVPSDSIVMERQMIFEPVNDVTVQPGQSGSCVWVLGDGGAQTRAVGLLHTQIDMNTHYYGLVSRMNRVMAWAATAIGTDQLTSVKSIHTVSSAGPGRDG